MKNILRSVVIGCLAALVLPALPAGAQTGDSCIPISIGADLHGPTNDTVTVPITAGDLTGAGAIAYDFIISFDPNVIHPNSSNPVDKTGTLSSNLSITPNTGVAGQLRVSAFGVNPLSGAGTLLNLRFDVIGTTGTETNLAWTHIVLNEGNPCNISSGGHYYVTSPFSISGNVVYGTTPVNQSPKSVPNVIVSAAGSRPFSALTNSSGDYLLNGFGSGGYTVTPVKTGDINKITSGDATLVLRHVASGGTLLTPNQAAAADANNSGTVTSGDATLILRYVAANGPTAQTGVTGTWKFIPSSRAYPSISSSLAGENFTAILIGEVSGDWTPSSPFVETRIVKKDTANSFYTIAPAGDAAPFTANENGREGITVSLAAASPVAAGSTVSLPLLVNKAAAAYSFTVNFDPNILRPAGSGFDTAGTLSAAGYVVVSDTSEPGRISIAAANPYPASDNRGVLLNLRFDVLGTAGTSTFLSFGAVNFDDEMANPINAARSEGTSFIVGDSGPSVGKSFVTGRVMTAEGQGIPSARVSVSGPEGLSKTAVTNPFGYYRFDEIREGADYTFVVSAKNYRFRDTLIVRAIAAGAGDIDFVAD
jgi:Cohesin domain/Carboxypeptidase regulatory-like domain/Dockerin type I domain